MTHADELDALVKSLDRARSQLRIEWEAELWKDSAFFPANEALVEAIIAVIQARDKEAIP